MVFATAGLVLTLVTAPANVTGKWDGTLTGLREDGSKSEDTALMILEQKDTTITGTVGGRESDQHPITSGKIEGNKITLDAKTESGREIHIELTLENDEMKGTIVAGERRGELQFRKRKDGLYDALSRADSSPVIELNRAVAVAMRDGPGPGLVLIDAILNRGDLVDYHLAHAARAEMCRRLERTADARASYERALALARQEPERRFLERRLAELNAENGLQ